MTTVERSIFVEGSPEEIDAVTLDGTRLPEWYAGVEQAEPDDLYPEPGGSVQMVYRAAGISFSLTMTSLEISRGEYAVFELSGMIAGTNRWDYSPEGGGTWVTATFDYDLPGGGLGKVADRLVVEHMNTENLEHSLANLKAVVEG